MEGFPAKPIIKGELNKTEQNVEQFSFSEQEKNIQEVFKLSPELKNIAVETIRSDKNISLYRIENKNIKKEPDGITSHKDLKGQWFTPNLETAIGYLRKSQQTFGAETERVNGANLIVVKIPKEEFENLHVSKHPIASQMDVENDNYIIPENIERNYINLDDVQDKVGNFENLQKAKKQVKDKVEQFEEKEAIKLYKEYLKTIFPESKFKGIFYHGSDNKFESFLSPGKDGYEKKGYNPTGDAGIYFSDKLNYAEQYVGRTGRGLKNNDAKGYVYPVLVNIKNPLTVSERYDDGLTPNTHLMTKLWNIDKNFLEYLNSNNYDGVVSGKFLRDTRGQNEIAVLSSDQIHILGNKQDIEQFKEFVSKSEDKKDRQSIEEFLKESGIEKVPNIETHFFFNSHATTEDGQMVANRLDDKYIFIQENAGWDKERLETWHKISKGEFTPEQAIENEKGRGKAFFWPDYFKAIFEKLQGTNKEVLLVDIKSDSEIYNEIYDLMRKDGIYWNILDRSKSFEENCERIADVSELESITQKERENEILDNMKTSLLELLKEKPELQGKENLKILFSMGAFHTRLYHEMKKSGDNVSREIPSSSYTFNPRMAVERIIHFKGSEKAKEYMPKILLSFLLQRLNMKYDDISKKVLSRFSDEQIRELFEMYKKSESDDQFRNEAQAWIIEQFKKK